LFLEEFNFLLKESLLFIELGLGGHARSQELLSLFFLGSHLAFLLVKLALGVLAEGLKSFVHLLSKLFFFLSQLTEALSEGLFLRQGFSSFGLKGTELALEEVDLAAGILFYLL
jgi:hypothetical protein